MLPGAEPSSVLICTLPSSVLIPFSHTIFVFISLLIFCSLFSLNKSCLPNCPQLKSWWSWMMKNSLKMEPFQTHALSWRHCWGGVATWTGSAWTGFVLGSPSVCTPCYLCDPASAAICSVGGGRVPSLVTTAGPHSLIWNLDPTVVLPQPWEFWGSIL